MYKRQPESQRSIENLEEIYIYPACELVLTEEERRNGVAKIQKEAEKAAEKFRKEMKTEEAYRVKSMADQIAEEKMCIRDSLQGDKNLR